MPARLIFFVAKQYILLNSLVEDISSETRYSKHKRWQMGVVTGSENQRYLLSQLAPTRQ